MDIGSSLKYIEEVIKSPKVQLVCAGSFGLSWYLFNDVLDTSTRLFLSIFTLLPIIAFIWSALEFIVKKCNCYLEVKNIYKVWNNLSSDEVEFIRYYIKEDKRYRYVEAYSGTYRDSAIINPLIAKNILFLSSGVSEYRRANGPRSRGATCFPVNIHDDAFAFFKKKFDEK